MPTSLQLSLVVSHCSRRVRRLLMSAANRAGRAPRRYRSTRSWSERFRVVAALVGTGKGRVSIDTTKREVAEAAIGAGATLVNDITGELWPVAAEAGVGWVAMHKQGTPLTMQVDPHYDDVVAEVLDWCVRRATLARSAGVTEVWIDPGLGFGKRREHNLSLLGHVRRFVDSGYPVLIGASRKSFLGDVTTFRGQTSGPNELSRRHWPPRAGRCRKAQTWFGCTTLLPRCRPCASFTKRCPGRRLRAPFGVQLDERQMVEGH